MKGRFLGAALAAALLLGGCAGSATPAGDEAAAAADRDASGAAGDVAADAKRKKNRDASAASSTSAGSSKAARSTGGGAGKTSTKLAAPEGTKVLPPGVVTDATGDQFAVDAETGAPAGTGVGGPVYTDIVRASVQDRGAAYRFTLRFAGPLPDATGDDETVIAGIGLTDSDGRTFTVLLQGTRDGWKTSYQDGEASGAVDDWSIEGAEVVWTVAKSNVDVGETFEWGASLRLMHPNAGGVPKGDKAPEDGPRQYPEE